MGTSETRVGIFVLIALGIFSYMGFRIGAFRFDRSSYAQYKLFFKDVSGLSRKADVKIAGVKVGWVEDVTLVPQDEVKAAVHVMVLKEYALYSDSYSMVRQEGLLGPRYIEIVPGDPLLRKLKSGDSLGRPSTEPVTIDELLAEFKQVATNISEITQSFKDVVGGPEGRVQMQDIFNNIQSASERLSSIGQTLDRAFDRNEEHIDSFLQIGTTFQDNLEKVSDVFDRDFDRMATQFEQTARSFEDASLQARDGLRAVSSVAEKIDEGKGLLGKLINEDETYTDLKLAIEGFKNYVTKIDRMQIIFDSHFESMIRRGEGYEWEDAKGFFNMRIYPREDYFYQLQIVSSEKGYIHRKFVETDYFDAEGKQIDTTALQNAPIDEEQNAVNNLTRFAFIFDKREKETKRDAYKIDFQFGKIFKDIALRIGLFEGTAGVGMDVDVPFHTDKFRWVTTLEMYDFNGRNRRILDRRPHFKWLNKMYLFRNLYTTFGADDFASQKNASVFFGAGLRFGDDDVKYFLSSLSGVGSTSFLNT